MMVQFSPALGAISFTTADPLAAPAFFDFRLLVMSARVQRLHTILTLLHI
jgi:hypothetical protein